MSPTVTHSLVSVKDDVIKVSLCWLTEPRHLLLPRSAQMHMTNAVPTSSDDQSDIVLFPYNRSMRSSGTFAGKGERHTDGRPATKSESGVCFHVGMWHITLKQVMHSYCQNYLGRKRKMTPVLHEKLFQNNMKFIPKEYWAVGCLWHCWRPPTASCQAARAIFFLLLATPHIFSCYASFLLIQQLTRRHPAAPLLDRVETRLGAGQLILYRHTW